MDMANPKKQTARGAFQSSRRSNFELGPLEDSLFGGPGTCWVGHADMVGLLPCDRWCMLLLFCSTPFFVWGGGGGGGGGGG